MLEEVEEIDVLREVLVDCDVDDVDKDVELLVEDVEVDWEVDEEVELVEVLRLVDVD